MWPGGVTTFQEFLDHKPVESRKIKPSSPLGQRDYFLAPISGVYVGGRCLSQALCRGLGSNTPTLLQAMPPSKSKGVLGPSSSDFPKGLTTTSRAAATSGLHDQSLFPAPGNPFSRSCCPFNFITGRCLKQGGF